MQGLVATEKDNDKLLENGRDIARGLWEQLRDQAGENDSLGGIRGTVDRIVTRLREMVKGMQDAKIAAEAKKEETNAALDDYENQLYERAIAAGVDESSAKAAAQAAREMSGHVTFTTTPEGKLKKVDEGDDDGLLPSPVAKLLKESQGMWSEVRADESINALRREGFDLSVTERRPFSPLLSLSPSRLSWRTPRPLLRRGLLLRRLYYLGAFDALDVQHHKRLELRRGQGDLRDLCGESRRWRTRGARRRRRDAIDACSRRRAERTPKQTEGGALK